MEALRGGQEIRKRTRPQERKEWLEWARTESKPHDIPISPEYVYKGNGWRGWGDWLGTGYVANQNRQYLAFEEGREYVRGLGLKNKEEWQEWVDSGDKPENLPADPHWAYKSAGWRGWGDWFGTGYVANQNRKYRPFNQAREFVRSLGIKNRDEWREYCQSGKMPADIPANPPLVYGKKKAY